MHLLVFICRGSARRIMQQSNFTYACGYERQTFSCRPFMFFPPTPLLTKNMCFASIRIKEWKGCEREDGRYTGRTQCWRKWTEGYVSYKVSFLKSRIMWIKIINICICDAIKQNESELANIDFKIQSNEADSFFCFLLFLQSFNRLYL